jgi:predicted DNA binding CopG/RHH family protein
MPRRSTSEIKSEAEEAAWYATPQGRQQTRREFERALRSGTALRSEGSKIPRTDAKALAELMELAKANATRAISIRLPIADIERARRIAAKQGIGYQTVLKQAIRVGLKKAPVRSTRLLKKGDRPVGPLAPTE